MTTVSAMLPVAIPRFAPSAPGIQPQGAAPQTAGQTVAWAAVGDGAQSGDPLDFDLLAEYLLDDAAAVGTNSAGMPKFDFSEATTGSGVVSPEQSEDGFPPIAEATPRAPPQVTAPGPAPVAPPATAPVPGPPQQPVLAPAPPMAPQGMSVPHHPGIPMAPAPGAAFPPLPATVPPPIVGTPGLVLHQHPGAPAMPPSVPGNKRRRVDVPTQVLAGTAAPQPQIINGHLLPHAGMPGRGRQKTQAQIDRRRERNRILARRTRLRKKFFFESLQKEVADLQRENAILKDLARKKLDPAVSKELLSSCKAIEQLPSAVHEAVGENGADIDSQDFNLVRSIQRSQQCFVITDPSLQDNPIVYASDDFLTLTGYKREEVLGRNCRFLQGTETSARKVEQLRKSIAMGEDATVTMINYTADGTAFWNKLFIAALRDAQNNIVNFIGVIVKVAAPDPDDPEAGKRLPGEQPANTNGEGAMLNGTQDELNTGADSDGSVGGAVAAPIQAAPTVGGAQS